MENQLTILSESLDKKMQVLRAIQEYNVRQEKVFLSEKVDMDSFDEAVEEKGRLIDALSKLDEGFETMYQKLSVQLQDNREAYAQQIQILKQKVADVMDLSVSIQAQEARNKQLIEKYFARERQEIKQNRKTAAAAYSYYKKANYTDITPPQYMDSKQ